MSERVLRPGLIEAEWKVFLKAVDPQSRFIEAQRQEMRKAFHAGFGSCFAMIRAAMDTAMGIECDEKGARILEGTMDLIHGDMLAFSAEQRALAAKMGIKTVRVETGDGLDRT